jgi:hypothetical protein
MNIKHTPIGSVGDDEAGQYWSLVYRYTSDNPPIDLLTAYYVEQGQLLNLQPAQLLVGVDIFEDWLAERLPNLQYSRCGHEHDCCGCVGSSTARVVGYDDASEAWIMRQSWHRNI